MKKQQIRIGDPQPLDCPTCNTKHGYCFADYISLHYSSFYKPDGSEDGGAYSDSVKTINKGVTATCVECHSILPFKINRSK